MAVPRAILLSVPAGLAEIGGGYLVSRWLRGGAALWVGPVGGVAILVVGAVGLVLDSAVRLLERLVAYD